MLGTQRERVSTLSPCPRHDMHLQPTLIKSEDCDSETGDYSISDAMPRLRTSRHDCEAILMQRSESAVLPCREFSWDLVEIFSEAPVSRGPLSLSQLMSLCTP